MAEGVVGHAIRAFAPSKLFGDLEKSEMTKARLLAALDTPRKTNSVLMVVNPGGSAEQVQTMLMEMRDEGLVKFDINKGLWSRA